MLETHPTRLEAFCLLCLQVVVWNIGQLANALKPLLNSSQQVHMSHLLKTLDTYCKNKIL